MLTVRDWFCHGDSASDSPVVSLGSSTVVHEHGGGERTTGRAELSGESHRPYPRLFLSTVFVKGRQ